MKTRIALYRYHNKRGKLVARYVIQCRSWEYFPFFICWEPIYHAGRLVSFIYRADAEEWMRLYKAVTKHWRRRRT